jgi:hypothetical protein
MLGARLLAVLSSFGAVLVFAPVATAEFAGGGSPKSDCYVVYDDLQITSGKNKSECTDGDPSCDTDGQCQGTCSFGITTCLNATNVPGCTPSNVSAITVNGTTLDLPSVPSSENVCGDRAIVAVPVKQTAKGAKKGKLKVKVTATSLSKPKKDKDAFTLFCLPREGSCPAQPSTTSSTLASVSTTSTSLSSSTSVPVPTTTSTSGTSTTSSTETSTTVTSTTSNTDPTTSTTSTTIGGGGCCNGAGFVSVVTKDASGDCGDLLDQNGMLVRNIDCAGLFTGGGGNSVPLPFTVPDLGTAVSAITACTGGTQNATLGGTTSAETGSNRNCTSVGCLFGAPLAVPNPGSTPTSVCVLNAASSAVTGSLVCDTGATTVNLPLTSVLFLTGDTATDPGASITGIQPCPLCSGTTCIGGPNNGMTCEPGTTGLGGDPAYPTSHDCPPDPMFNIGSLPISFSLTSGTVSWSGTPATNDTGGTFSTQNRVFSGFCRDAESTGCFKGDDDPMCPTATPGFQQCWENGMAVGAACSGDYESCEQRTNGAFGPAGGANRTIIAIGAGTSLLGGPADGTLVSVFSIPPTFDATVDSAGDLPGPGAVALPGTATLCSDAMDCP